MDHLAEGGDLGRLSHGNAHTPNSTLSVLYWPAGYTRIRRCFVTSQVAAWLA
jgi:hypothetical protein